MSSRTSLPFCPMIERWKSKGTSTWNQSMCTIMWFPPTIADCFYNRPEYCLLGCYAIKYCRTLPTFKRYIKKLLLTTWHHFPQKQIANMRHLRLGQPDKSAVAQHTLETGHRVEFNNTCRLARTKGYMDRIIKEAIEIKLHPDNINRDGGYILSKAWQPAIRRIGTSQRGVRARQLTARPPT
jgi:hypothetical protein